MGLWCSGLPSVNVCDYGVVVSLSVNVWDYGVVVSLLLMYAPMV